MPFCPNQNFVQAHLNKSELHTLSGYHACIRTHSTGTIRHSFISVTSRVATGNNPKQLLVVDEAVLSGA